MTSKSDAGTRAVPPSRVLLMEDNGMIAMNLHDMLIDLGVKSVLLAMTVHQAQSVLAENLIDFAILDFQIGAETSVPVAMALHDAAIPFVFSSGHGDNVLLPSELAGTPLLPKPFLMTDLAAALAGQPRKD